MTTTLNLPLLSGLKATSIIIILTGWFIGLVLILAQSQSAHSTSPAFLLHASCLLLLLLLVRLFKGHWASDLGMNPTRFFYLFIAAFIGFIFWQFQQFITVLMIPVDWEQDALQWQQSQKGFTMWSVFLASCVMGPLFEELLFRGLIFTQLKHKMGLSLAIICSSGFFTLIHWNFSEIIWLFSAGVLYALLREKSKSIWPAVIAHMIQNVLTFWLYVSV